MVRSVQLPSLGTLGLLELGVFPPSRGDCERMDVQGIHSYLNPPPWEQSLVQPPGPTSPPPRATPPRPSPLPPNEYLFPPYTHPSPSKPLDFNSSRPHQPTIPSEEDLNTPTHAALAPDGVDLERCNPRLPHVVLGWDVLATFLSRLENTAGLADEDPLRRIARALGGESPSLGPRCLSGSPRGARGHAQRL